VTKPEKKRHGSTLHVDLPVVAESTLRERAELCLAALAKSEGLKGCDGGAGDEPCMFPRCIADGCDGGRP
jgi:hypothetical protein